MTSTHGFLTAGNKLTLPGARLWKYPLSIPDNCASHIAHGALTSANLGFLILDEFFDSKPSLR
jgi:hypothetical protein